MADDLALKQSGSDEQMTDPYTTARKMIECAVWVLDGISSEEDERLIAEYVVSCGKDPAPAPAVIIDAAARVNNRNGSDLDKVTIAAYAIGRLNGLD